MSAKQFALNHLTHLPHKNMIRTILRALVVVICHLPVFSSAATNVSIHAEWQTYTAPSGYTVGGFNLYQEDQLACQTQGATSTTVDCLVSLSADSTNFTLAAVFTNGTESPKSAPFTFVTPSGTETETPQQATSPPTAVISTSTAAGKAPLTVSFYAGGSSSSTGTTIASHVWNFGDNSSGTGVSPSHTYTAAGTYSATLTVTDSAGLKSSVGTPIVVTASAATGTTAPVPSTSTSTTRQLLWAQVGGGVSIWTLDGTNNRTSYKTYGPFSGWTPVSISQNEDGTRTLLWGNAAGIASIWTLDSANNYISYKTYGPFSGWTPVSISQNEDGTRTLLWGDAAGIASIWKLDSVNNYISYKTYGPYSNLVPISFQ